MTLYQIDQEIQNCVDPETGEIINQEALDELNIEREQKIEAVALWIKNLDADALAFEAEKKAFESRQKAAEKKAEQLRKWITIKLDGQKFTTHKCAVSFRASEKVEIKDKGAIPKEYMAETVKYEPDKILIREAIKSGIAVTGAELVKNLNAQIK